MLLHASRQKSTFVKLSASCLRPVATSFVSFSGLAEESSSFEDTSRQAVVKDKRFIDKVRIKATAGSGGTGCESYIKRSRKGITRPIPDGGHGGQGGNVIVEACSSVRDLQDVKFTQRAAPGGPGGSQKRAGLRGHDRVIKVPVGTCISPALDRNAEQSIAGDIEGPLGSFAAGEAADEQLCSRETHDRTIADLDAPAARVLVAVGGLGGRGSVSKGSADDETRLDAHQGRPGEEVLLQLELKLLADVGFVGVPNVGKSTLLKALTSAKPRIANYPFTTLQPQLGILEVDQKQIVLADIPGLIAGASQNKGRGFAFLRHVERTRMLAYVLDLSSVSGMSTGPSPLQQLADLQAEVRQYSSELPEKSAIIVGNKLDQLVEEGSKSLDELKIAAGIPVHFVSAKYGHGIRSLREALSVLVTQGTDNSS